MVVGTLGTPGETHARISDRDAATVVRLLKQLNPNAPELALQGVERRLDRINQSGGVAIIRKNCGEIVAMGTWTVVPTLMRTTALASDVIVDQAQPEWERFLEELLRYLIGRANRAMAERIDLTWNLKRPGHEVYHTLGFETADANLLRLVLKN